MFSEILKFRKKQRITAHKKYRSSLFLARIDYSRFLDGCQDTPCLFNFTAIWRFCYFLLPYGASDSAAIDIG